ncbi:GvpL/GvpF family gas vesicle protein [Alkalicoccus urumqiensis]|uniref:GvpL/GvpF family gas vesicle protein n=1 Tax=Alkalicoccus urumqiensis TaxID=1548213 RepID=UPI0015E5A808|nr:GvpL/GvpF family gas vesicle protein [Alkalicoccus urumqiensis]
MKSWYVYGYTNRKPEEAFVYPGIDGEPVQFVSEGELFAAATEVDAEEFQPERLQEKVEEPVWVQEKAAHHHQVVQKIFENVPVLPVSFGTVFASKPLLPEEKESYLQSRLKEVDGREEWKVKLFLHVETWMNHADSAREMEESIAGLSKGKQFFARKKLQQDLRARAEQEAEERASELFHAVASCAEKAERKKTWEKQVSGRREEMAANDVFLFYGEEQLNEAASRIKAFKEEEEKLGRGLIVEVSGPWPPYHFAAAETT